MKFKINVKFIISWSNYCTPYVTYNFSLFLSIEKVAFTFSRFLNSSLKIYFNDISFFCYYWWPLPIWWMSTSPYLLRQPSYFIFAFFAKNNHLCSFFRSMFFLLYFLITKANNARHYSTKLTSLISWVGSFDFVNITCKLYLWAKTFFI